MQVKKQQLEADMEHPTGSKLGKEYINAVYCHPAYLTYMQSATATAKSLQSCPTLCDPIDGSPPGSPIPGILQARVLEWDAIAFSDNQHRQHIKKQRHYIANKGLSSQSYGFSSSHVWM